MPISPITYELVHAFVEMEEHWQHEKARADQLHEQCAAWRARAEKAEQERDDLRAGLDAPANSNGSPQARDERAEARRAPHAGEPPRT